MGWGDVDVAAAAGPAGCVGPAGSAGAPPSWLREVQLSCTFLSQSGYEFVLVLSRKLVELLPRLPQEVPELAGLSADVARGLLWGALADAEPAAVEEGLRRLGSKIRRGGFPEDGYLALSHAVLRSARLMHGAQWTSHLSAAWVAYLTWFTDQLALGVHAMARQDEVTVGEAVAVGEVTVGEVAVGEGTVGEAAVDEVVVDEATGREGLPQTLDQVLVRLRERHFPLQARALRCPAEARQDVSRFVAEARALDALCERVSNRIGIDLRALRPEDEFDPSRVSLMLSELGELGYELRSVVTRRAGSPGLG